MKKCIVALVALLILLCGCQPTQMSGTASGNATQNQTTIGSEVTTPPTTADPEKLLRQRYQDAINALESYKNTNQLYTRYGVALRDTDAVDYLKLEFTEMQEYADCAQILSHFREVKVPTGKRYELQDRLGNKKTGNSQPYSEYIGGQKVTFESKEKVLEHFGVFYDAITYNDDTYDYAFTGGTNGQAAELKIKHWGKVLVVIKPEYDEQGRIISVVGTEATREYTVNFTYDEQGRLISVAPMSDWCGDIASYRYEYDADGRLKTRYAYYNMYKTISHYTYDDQGYLTQLRKEVTDPYYESDLTVTYTNDEQGNPISGEIVFTHSLIGYTTGTVTYAYVTKTVYVP